MTRNRFQCLPLLWVCGFLAICCIHPALPGWAANPDIPPDAAPDISEEQAEALTGKSGFTGGLLRPRFVSVNVGRANMRKGPGRQYPIAWVLVRRNLPVEVIEEYENWRRVRERSGETGWVHKAMLSGRRTAMITTVSDTDQLISVYRSASQDDPPVLMAQPGAIGEVNECDGDWCVLSFKQGRGWVRREHLWGVYPGEEIE